jgi:hypothetical protein
MCRNGDWFIHWISSTSYTRHCLHLQCSHKSVAFGFWGGKNYLFHQWSHCRSWVWPISLRFRVRKFSFLYYYSSEDVLKIVCDSILLPKSSGNVILWLNTLEIYKKFLNLICICISVWVAANVWYHIKMQTSWKMLRSYTFEPTQSIFTSVIWHMTLIVGLSATFNNTHIL